MTAVAAKGVTVPSGSTSNNLAALIAQINTNQLAFAYVKVMFPSGSTCSATNGSTVLTSPTTSGVYIFGIPTPSSTPETWTFTCSDGSLSESETCSITERYQIEVIQLTYGVPSAYTQLTGIRTNYNENSSTYWAYVDTGLGVPADNEELTVVFKHNSSINSPVGSVMGASAYSQVFGLVGGYLKWNNTYYPSTSSGSFYSASSSQYVFTVIINDDNRKAKYKRNNTTTFTELCDTIQPAAPSGTGNIYLLASHANTGSTAADSGYHIIYSYQRRNKTTNQYIQDFVPCRRNSDLQLGFFDLVSRNFYECHGTGAYAVT